MPKQAPINTITVKIWEDKGSIDFKADPSGFQLMAAKIILQEFLDFHFTQPEQAQLAVRVYNQIQNVEEVGQYV